MQDEQRVASANGPSAQVSEERLTGVIAIAPVLRARPEEDELVARLDAALRTLAPHRDSSRLDGTFVRGVEDVATIARGLAGLRALGTAQEFVSAIGGPLEQLVAAIEAQVSGAADELKTERREARRRARRRAVVNE